MKKLMTAIFCCMMLATVIAQPRPNEAYTSLVIGSITSDNFWLYIDDVLYNENSVNSIEVQKITTEKHTVKIVMDAQNRRNNEWPTHTSSLNIHPGRNGYSLIFNRYTSEIDLEDNPVTFGAKMKVEYRPNNHQSNHHGNHPGNNHGNQPPHGNDHGNHPGNNHGHQPGNNNQQGHHHNETNHSDNQTVVVVPVPVPVPTPEPAPTVAPEPASAPSYCPADKFSRIKASIQSESFENDKMNVAKQAMKGNLFTVDQITEIANLFTFERDKLDFLKYAYDFCFDKENYFQLNSVLTYSSSKKELNKFLQNK